MFLAGCGSSYDDVFKRGISYAEEGKYDRAISDYSKAIELDTRFYLAYVNRGNAYDTIGRYDRAISDYNKAIELNPREYSTYYNRGRAYTGKGQYDLAISDYNKAIELNPRDVKDHNRWAYLGRARAYASKEDYDSALDDVSRAHKPKLGILREMKPPISLQPGKEETVNAMKESSMDDLMVALKSDDSSERAAAAKVLGLRKVPEGVEPLIGALGDKDEFVRAGAACALGELKDSRATQPLISALNDRSGFVKINAACALGHMGDERAYKALMAKLMDISIDDTIFLGNVLWALKMIKEGPQGKLEVNLKKNVVEPQSYVVMLETSMGNIVIELNEQAAPVTVKNFLGYVMAGFYNSTIFHRVIPGFMIQGGGLTTDMAEKGTNDPIINEASNGLKNLRGTIAMARSSKPDSATTQFFINHVNNPHLDYITNIRDGYAVFGKVIEGMDVVDTIASVKTTTWNGMYDVPVEPVIIISAKVIQAL